MDLELNEDQSVLVAALSALTQHDWDLPPDQRASSSYFAADLWRRLEAGGFLETARTLGPLEAAMVVVEISRLPVTVETGASALVVPQLLSAADGPVALITGPLERPQRFLSVARTALVDLGDDVAVLRLKPEQVEPYPTIYAYPYGRFTAPPDLAGSIRLGAEAREVLIRWWRIAIAAECAGAAQSAVEFTVEYVKRRKVFGRAIGSFQAVQHRLAQCIQIARGIRLMALHAAWRGDDLYAELAAAYAQQHIQKLVFDLHQFNGGMGVTNEHKLHFWTYRLRALQAELGGADEASLDAARHLWDEAAA